MNKISVISLDKRFEKFEKNIKSITGKTLKFLKKDGVSVEIYLAGDARMRFLNRKFRKKDKAANVLSFEEPKNFVYPKSRIKRMGEIYLNLSNAEYRASSELLLIHGLLHLFGYSHKGKSDRIKMEKKENSLIKRLNK